MERASPPASSSSSSPPRKKRRRGEDRSRPPLENEYLLPGPDGGAEEDAGALGSSGGGSLDFHELLDEDALRHKFTVVNRAPVMMAWACIVAERLGFSRDEALSIGTYPFIHNEQFTPPLSPPQPDFLSLSLSLIMHIFPFYLCSVCVYRNERGFQGRLARRLRQET